MIFLLRGNISKWAKSLASGRFRCRYLASGQYRCWVFVSGRFRCFLKNLRLCGQY